MRRLLVAAACLAALTGSALAQDPGNLPPRDLPSNGGAGVRTGHITSTGATVPNPGEPQSAGNTALDRNIQTKDNSIDSSICKGC